MAQWLSHPIEIHGTRVQHPLRPFFGKINIIWPIRQVTRTGHPTGSWSDWLNRPVRFSKLWYTYNFNKKKGRFKKKGKLYMV